MHKNPNGTCFNVNHYHLLFDSLLTCLFTLMRGGGHITSNVASNASGLLRNLALDKKFRAHFRGDIEQNVLPNFETLLVSYTY